MNMETNKLETTLTNPGHKFWEVKGHCVNALNKYTEKYFNNINKVNLLKQPHPNNLKVVEFSLLLNGVVEENI